MSYGNLHDMTNSINGISEVQLAARVLGNAALGWKTVHRQVWGKGSTSYPLSQNWVNLRILAQERQQTIRAGANNSQSHNRLPTVLSCRTTG